MTQTPYFSIIITSFNEGEWLQRTVDGIFSDLNFLDYEVIIVNDGSTDNSCNFLDTLPYLNIENLKVYYGENLGVSLGRHTGAIHARGENLIFLDAHMQIEANWLEKIATILYSREDVHLLGISTYDIEGSPNQKISHFLYTNQHLSMYAAEWIEAYTLDFSGIMRVPYINASNFIIRKYVYDKIGGFPAFIEGWGPEDRTLCLLAYYQGFNTFLCPEITIGHHYKKNIELSQEVKDKKKRASYNALAVSYVCYPDSIFRQIYQHFQQFADFELLEMYFLNNKKKLTSYKKALKKNKIRTWNDFCKEFHEVLPFVYTGYFERAVFCERFSLTQSRYFAKKALLVGLMTSEKEKILFLATIHVFLGKLYVHENKNEMALQEYYKAMMLSPIMPMCLMEIAKVYYEGEQYEESLGFLFHLLSILDQQKTKNFSNKFLSCSEDISDVYRMISSASFYIEDYISAIQYAKLVLVKFPEDQKILENIKLYEKLILAS